MRLYHGTTVKVATLALKQGLTPRNSHGKSNWKHTVESNPDLVYLTTAYAAYYAMCATDSDSFGIVEIDTDWLDDDKMLPDEDFIEQATRNNKKAGVKGKTMEERTAYIRDHIHGFQSYWETSVKHLGNCAHEGLIPPSAIKRVSIVKWKKCKAMSGQAMQPAIVLANFALMGKRYELLTKWFSGHKVSFDEWTKTELGYEIFPADWKQKYVKQLKPILEDQSMIKVLTR
jgi:hypothetical protein